MIDLLKIFVDSMLVDNIVLLGFLGICSFLGVSTKTKNAAGMSAAVVVVMIVSVLITWPLYEFVLKPAGVSFIQTIAFILVIASLVQIIEMFIKKSSPGLYSGLGIFLPLITTNCAILGTAIKVTDATKYTTFGHVMVATVGTALGYALVMIIFSAIRERLIKNNVPKSFQGVPIALITAGIMAFAFTGLAGLIK